jgi:hypothetical protein
MTGRPRLLTADLVFTVGFVALSVAVLMQAREWPFRGALFPRAAGWMMLAAAALNLVLLLVSGRSSATGDQTREDSGDRDLEDVFVSASREEWMAALGWMGSFFLVLWLLGAFVAIPAFAALYLLVASRESPSLAFVYAFVCWVFVYGLFDRILHVPLPRGVLLSLVSGS